MLALHTKSFDVPSNDQAKQSLEGFGELAMRFCGKRLPLQVLKSNRGHYIGTMGENGPCSRESVEYWPTASKAQAAFTSGSWTQKVEP